MSYLEKKLCGNCKFWTDIGVEESKLCGWEPLDLPFWASINEGADHDNYTLATDGYRCKTWKQKND